MTAQTSSRRFFAPGRFNIIGEHVDYCGGLVLPAALQLGATVTATPLSLSRLDVLIGADGGSYRFERLVAYRDWEGYVVGMAWKLAEALGLKDPPGARLEIVGTVPLGQGMSSSAALEVSVGLALWTLWADAGIAPPIDRLQLAKVAQHAEHACAGTKCGLMDQYASVFGDSGHALLMDCQAETHTPIALPPSFGFVVVDCGVKHDLGDGPYGQRRRSTERAARRLGVGLLRNVEDAAQLSALKGLELKRARHVVSEIARTRQAVLAIEASNGERLGELMAASHGSLRDDMEVSCAELDGLQDMALQQEGVLGARMMGGGFGGSVIALVDAAGADQIGAELAGRWGAKLGRPVDHTVCIASNGARELD